MTDPTSSVGSADHDPAITDHPFLQEAAASAEAAMPRFMREAKDVAVFWPVAWRLGLVALALVGAAAALAWALHPAPPVPENTAPAPQVRQADGSVLAERAPPSASQPLAPPTHMLPRGAHEERRERIVVAPAPAASTVEVDLSLVRQGDERRVVASSPDGQVLQAIDIPIDPSPLPPAPRPWAAGLAYRTDRAVGLWVERDVGRLRLGAEVVKAPQGRPQAELRVGVSF